MTTVQHVTALGALLLALALATGIDRVKRAAPDVAGFVLFVAIIAGSLKVVDLLLLAIWK